MNCTKSKKSLLLISYLFKWSSKILTFLTSQDRKTNQKRKLIKLGKGFDLGNNSISIMLLKFYGSVTVRLLQRTIIFQVLGEQKEGNYLLNTYFVKSRCI